MTIHQVTRRTHAAAFALVCMVSALACSGGESGQNAASVPLAERVQLEGFSFQPPTGWKAEAPSSGMRLAQERIDAAPGDTDAGECALFHFPG